VRASSRLVRVWGRRTARQIWHYPTVRKAVACVLLATVGLAVTAACGNEDGAASGTSTTSAIPDQHADVLVTIDPRVFRSDEDPGGEGAREDVLIADADDVAGATKALGQAADRWWLIDGTGREHVEGTKEYEVWQDALFEGDRGDEIHSLRFVSDIEMDARGPWLFIDAESYIPPLMREAYLRVLIEELDRVGVKRATVTVRYEDEE
jgi:hypothetical protein